MGTTPSKRNRRLILLLGLLPVGMFGFGFAMVPLYGVLCRATGIQTAQRAVAAKNVKTVVSTRMVTVKFAATVEDDLPWSFIPSHRVIRVPVGQVERMSYKARNLSDQSITGQAVYSVAPWQATQYFSKTECFCFKQQRLKGGEAKIMPLAFVVSPDLPKGIDSLTLSYTFMNVDAATHPGWERLQSHHGNNRS